MIINDEIRREIERQIEYRGYKFNIDDVFKIVDDYKNKIIPNNIDSEILCCYPLRDYFISAQGFALVTNAWIKPLADIIGSSKCLEVMAGKGTISYALQQHGVDIKATDNYSWEGSFNFDDLFTDVENIDAVEAIKKYGKDVEYVIMSWPYMDKTCYEVVKKLYEVNPHSKLIYIGESDGGCTACDEFFDFFFDMYKNNIDNEYYALYMNTKLNIGFKSWYGIHDRIYLFDFDICNGKIK